MANVDLIYQEYPFLNKYAKRKHVDDAKVGRWTEDFLKTRRIGQYFHARLFLLDADGAKIASVDGGLGYLLPTDETVERALARIGRKRARQITQALYITPGVRGNVITLLKVPHGHTNADGWYQAVLEKERTKLQSA